MTVLRDTNFIRRPAKEVWAILADVGGISKWNPNITNSYLLPGPKHGVGTSRHCDIEGGWFKERVAEWKEGETMSFRVFEMSQPMRSMTGTFHLRERRDGTEVEFVVDYAMKWGVLGRLLDRLVIRRTFAKYLPRVLQGLKAEAEAVP